MYRNCCDFQCSVIFQMHEHKETQQLSILKIANGLHIFREWIGGHIINAQFKIIWTDFIIIGLQIHQNNMLICLIMKIFAFQKVPNILRRHFIRTVPE